MLGRDRFHWAVAFVLAAIPATVAVGCGDEGSTTSSGASSSSSSGSTSTSSSSSTGSSSSSSSGGDLCPSKEGTVLAVRTLAFGEGNSGEWKKVGFDLDGKTSTAVSNDLCQPNAGGLPSTAYPDGDNGIDNSFGKNLLPTILSLYPNWPKDVNTGISNGNFTGLLKLMCLPPEGDVPVMMTKLFGATSLGMMPKWDGTDLWPVEPSLLTDPLDADSSSLLFPTSSVTGDLYDAGKDGTFILSIPVKTAMSSTSIKLTLHAAKVNMTLSKDRLSATAGMLGGVLDTEEFVAELKKLGVLLNLCGNPLFDNLLLQVRQASDIMVDGTQDPNQTCNGISAGLGFEMMAALRGEVGPANPQGASCP